MRINHQDDEGYCFTTCPYGVTNGYTGDAMLVGSNGCSDCCHFIENNLEENWIECDCEETKQEGK